MTEPKSVEDYATYQIAHYMFLILSPVLMVLGIVGNTLSFLVFFPKAKARKHQSSHFYLALLGVVDTFSLIASALPGFIRHASRFDVYFHTGCSYYLFMQYTATDISIYVIIWLTIDRAINVYMPYKARILCTRNRAIVSVLVTTFVLICINIHLTFTSEQVTEYKILPENTTHIQYCVDTEEHRNWNKFIWPWIDMTVLFFFPFLNLLVLNGGILAQMSKQARKVHADGQVPEHRIALQKKMNILVVSICVVFFLSTAPITSLHIVRHYWDRDEPSQAAAYALAQAFLSHLGYLTNCVNILLYCCSGSNFRQGLIRVLRVQDTRNATMTARTLNEPMSTTRRETLDCK